MTGHAQPGRLEDVRIAVICALPREYDAAILVFDEIWKEDENILGPTRGQNHNHTIGRIGNHVVVLVLLLNMGKVGAATETARLKSIYPGLELALLTGICGGVPSAGTNNEILLGDVIISKSIVQYDIGRQYPGKFARKNTVEDSLGRPNKDIRTLLIVLETQSALSELQQRVSQSLARVQQRATDANYRTSYSRPSAAEDVLFEPTYHHRHRDESGCGCTGSVACDQAISASCEELQCEVGHQVLRRRLAIKSGSPPGDGQSISTPEPRIHIGCVGSGDTVMKSGEHRDGVAKAHGLIAFEMEGAGVWDEIPCIVVKGVCDYADSHKNKKWQDFAAAMAAAATRALLGRYPARERLESADRSLMLQRMTISIPNTSHQPSAPAHYVIPLAKNKRFVERAETSELKQMLFDQMDTTVALVGLGGMGKTQIALDIAYWVKDNKPEFSVFWVPAVSFASFEKAYADIAKELGISTTTEGDDTKLSVKEFLSSKKAGSWLLIIDNADDMEILYGSPDKNSGLNSYLPQSDNGVTLFTTRVMDIALSVADDTPVELDSMNQGDAIHLFEKSLRRSGLLQDSDSILKLLDFLTHLPLAITQAAAYLDRNRHVSIAKYLQLLQGTEQTRISTLSRESLDRTRYPESRNAIATTWLISFDQIQQTDSYATELLYFISRIEPKSIPRSILYCSGSEEDMEYAIGTLCSYAFLVRHEDARSFDMHSLVHMAARIWAREQAVEEHITANAIKHLEQIFPTNAHENRTIWRQYMPHVLKFCNERTQVEMEVQNNLYYKVGGCLLNDARVKETLKLLEHISKAEKTLDERDPSRLALQHLLGIAYQADGRIKEAIQLLEHIVEVEATLDNGHPSRLSFQSTLAIVYQADGRVKEAIKLLEHVVEVEATLDKGHPSRLISQHTLARAYQADGRIKEAIPLLEHVARVEATTLDEGHPLRLSSQLTLAEVYLADGRVKEAIKLLEPVVEVRKKTLDEWHIARLTSEHALAEVYLADGRVEEATKLIEHVVEVRETIHDEWHMSRLASQHVLAKAYRANGRYQEAIELLEHVVRVEATTLDEWHINRLASQHALAEAYQANGRYQEAIELVEHVIRVEATILDDGHPYRLAAEQLLANILAELPTEALK